MPEIRMDMIKKTLPLQLFLWLVACHFMVAQKLPDSLKNKSYDYLIERLDSNDQDSTLTWLYLDAILAKAKHENNPVRISKAYEETAYISGREIYADSMLLLGQKVKNNDLIGKGYIVKGSLNYSYKRYAKALDNYLTASKFVEKSSDLYLKNTLKYNIANIKFYLGFYDEAAVLLKEASDYFKDENLSGYMNTMHSLGLAYNKMGKYDLCSEINAIGIEASKKATKTDRDYFIHSEGINQYCKKNYKEAIEKINASLPSIIANNDFANETVGYFYLGKSHMALGDTEKALGYFRKVDRAFTEKKYIRPDLRENYEILINHYKKQGDTKLQLHYVEKLLKADSLLTRNFKYISGKVHKEYDSRQLELARTRLLAELDKRDSLTYILFGTIGILFFLTLFLLYRYYINQRTYRQKFEALMHTSENTEMTAIATDIKPEEPKQLDINPDVVASILKQLDKFEANKKFLQKDLTLVNLAGTFGTNANYLSKVINHYKNKNYIAYLNDLRIDYIVSQLKNDARFRNYTIKALAEEAGFSTAQHFSKAFFSRTGIYPSYFVTELNREYVG